MRHSHRRSHHRGGGLAPARVPESGDCPAVALDPRTARILNPTRRKQSRLQRGLSRAVGEVGSRFGRSPARSD